MRRCPTCGEAAVARSTALLSLKRCPRCGYRGEGIPYFRRAGHVGLLIGVSLFTYGLGGLVYWLARRRYWVCPGCGLGWEHARAAREWGEPAPVTQWGGGEEGEGLPRGGMGRRVLGVTMIVLAVFLIVLGIAEGEIEAVVSGSFVGAAGSGGFWWGWKALQGRRRALLQRLQNRVLHLATERGGTLTVTEVAAAMNMPLPAAEKVLISMDDGFRVRSDITREGVLLYEFPEVLHRKRLESGS